MSRTTQHSRRWHALLAGIAAIAVLASSCTRTSSPVMSSTAQTIQFGSAMNEPWRTLNDGVMGGLSEGVLMLDDTSMRWTGQTRLENNGGFASIRAPWGHHDLRALNQAIVRCRGNGGPFKLTLENSQRWWMPYAYAEFDPSNEWQDIVLDLEDFSWSQAQMGDLKRVSPSSDLADVLRFGLMKYDGTAQMFELEVASIRFQP